VQQVPSYLFLHMPVYKVHFAKYNFRLYSVRDFSTRDLPSFCKFRTNRREACCNTL
jgi:hypothetical protein